MPAPSSRNFCPSGLVIQKGANKIALVKSETHVTPFSVSETAGVLTISETTGVFAIKPPNASAPISPNWAGFSHHAYSLDGIDGCSTRVSLGDTLLKV